MNAPNHKDERDETNMVFSLPPEPGSHRVMIVDDRNSISVVSVTDTGDRMEIIANLSDLEQALAHLEKTQQSEDFRRKIQLLLAHSENFDPESLDFLKRVQAIKQKPYVAVSGNSYRNIAESVADEYINQDVDPLKTIESLLPSVQQYWEENGNREEIELEPFTTAKYTPLPSLRLEQPNGNRTLLEQKEKGIDWLAMIDFDGTLFRTYSGGILLIDFAEFMASEHGDLFRDKPTNVQALEQLLTDGKKWAAQRKLSKGLLKVGDLIKYEEGIESSGLTSALVFENMQLADLESYAEEFCEKHLKDKGKFLDYNDPVLREIEDHGITPYLTTGLPDFLFRPILRQLRISRGHGMTYHKDREGWLIGEVEVNMGLAAEKARLGQKLTQMGYAIALAIGDSEGDMGMFRCAVGRSLSKWDLSGAAVLVNGTKEAMEEVERHYSNEKKDGRVNVVEEKLPASHVVSAVHLALNKIFEPIHTFRELRDDRRNSYRLAEFMTSLHQMVETGEIFPNLENLKRIRDILEQQGLPKEEMREILAQYIPRDLVEVVIKTHVLNTRIPDDVGAWLQRIGASRAEAARILELNSNYHKKHGSLAPMVRRMTSSVPPPGGSSGTPDDNSR